MEKVHFNQESLTTDELKYVPTERELDIIDDKNALAENKGLFVSRSEYKAIEDELDIAKQYVSDLEVKYQTLLESRQSVDRYSTRLLTVIAELFNNSLYSDVIIQHESGKKLYGHKLVLSSRSGKWNENLQNTDILHITAVSYDVMYTMVQWIYTDYLPINTSHTSLVQLLKLAILYQLDCLKNRCWEILSKIQRIESNKTSSHELADCLILNDTTKKQDYTFISNIISDHTYDKNCDSVCEDNESNGNKMDTDTAGDDSGGDNDSDDVVEDDNSNTENDNGDDNVDDGGDDDDEGDDDVDDDDDDVDVGDNNGDNAKCDDEKDAEEIIDKDDEDYSVSEDDKLTDSDEEYHPPKIQKQYKPKPRRPTPTSWTCELYGCEKTFETKKEYQEHFKYHVYKCKVCEKKFRKKAYLRSHLTSHEGLRPHQCELCGKSYRKPRTLEWHMKVHAGVRDLECKLCDKAFTYPASLRFHMLSHQTNRSQHLCDICGKGFYSPAGIHAHKQLKHSDLKPYTCTVCGKSYKTKPILRGHMETHAKGHFECDICHKVFNTRPILYSHRACHREKRFQCSVCNLTFARNNTLVRHMNIHERVLFNCDICNKSFKRKDYLNKHIKSHDIDGGTRVIVKTVPSIICE